MDYTKLNYDELFNEIKNLYNSYGSMRKVCSITNVSRYYVRKILFGHKYKEYNKICLNCGDNFKTKFNSKKFCKNECLKTAKKEYLKNRNYNYENLIKWRIDKKQKAVNYKGGCCIICKYNRSLSALEFHHLDPSKKDFAISKYVNIEFHKIKKELDKCILLCSNCHREIHDGLIDINNYDINYNIVGKESDFIKSERKKEISIKISKPKKILNKKCKICGKDCVIKNRCAKCASYSNRKINRPPYDILLNEVNDIGYCATGGKYGVSDNSIRKWIKMYKNE